jgi:hypothetical protein
VKDLNAYLSLWADERETSLETCVANCQKSELISKRILDVLADAKSDDDSALATWCIEYLGKIRSLGRHKMNQITLYILENIEKYIMNSEEEKQKILSKRRGARDSLGTTEKKDEDPLYKNEKLHKSVKEDVTVGIYINHNNRIYRPLPVDFEDVRGHIEMPKNLIPPNQPPDILIRSIWTSYNDLSNEVFTPLLPVGGLIVFDLYKFTDLFPQLMKGRTYYC